MEQKVIDMLKIMRNAEYTTSSNGDDTEFKKKAAENFPCFQLMSFHMGKTTGEVFMRGRGENDKNVGVLVNDYEHFFFVSRQTPYANEKDAARTLSMIEHGLRAVASGTNPAYKNEFRTPDPKYKSRNCPPKKVYVNDKVVSPYNPLITGWAFARDKQTVYGYVPEEYRENALVVYVKKPSHSMLIHQYIESDHFREYYTNGLRLKDDAFFKRAMLRTFEASLNADLVFRTKYDIWMCRWCTVNTASSSCVKDVPKERRKITCDEYYVCSATDITCDLNRIENANFVRMAYDIECPGKKKSDGNSRFPIALWGTSKFMAYAKDVLSLPPPVRGFTNISSKSNKRQNVENPWRARWNPNDNKYSGGLRSRSSSSSSASEQAGEEEEDGEYSSVADCENDRDDMLDMLLDMEGGGGTESGDGGADDKDNEGSDTSEEIKIKRYNEWINATKEWTPQDWLSWLRWALQKKYTQAELSEMIKKANLSTFEDLIPVLTDTDRVRCICVAVKHNNRDVGDNPLDFAERVAFAYEDPDMLEELKNRPANQYGANIWNFPSIDVRVFKNEAQMLNAYLNYVRDIGVDIKESWNGKTFDDVYVYDRLIYLQTYGTEEEKRYAQDVNFGFLKGENVQSRCVERFSSTKAAGDKLERSVTHDLLIHNDGLQIITNQSFGEKNRHNTLDYISMLKLIHSRSNIELVIDQMIKDNVVDPVVISNLYLEKMTPSAAKGASAGEESLPSLRDMMKAVFEDVPMRKMQFDINEGLDACMAGGCAFKDFIDYCYVDACLPILIGGKLSLQIAISRATNVTPSDVFDRGVQMKVLALIYSTCKKEFKGRYLIPDKGSLWLHWPCVFDDEELGFQDAVTSDPRLAETLWMNIVKKKKEEELAAKLLRSEREYTKEIEELGKTTKTVGSFSGRGGRGSRGRGGRGNAPFRGKTISNPNAKTKKTTSPSTVGVKKKTAEKKKGYTGAYVIPPTRRGPIPQPVGTLDFSSLYPSICFSRGLCYTTFLTSKGIRKWGIERWQYTSYVLGMASEISCGEFVVDSKAAMNGGYYSSELKIAHFYSAAPLNTVYGVLIKKLKVLRKVAKDKMMAAEDALEDIQVHESDGTPLAKGSRQEKLSVEGMPLPLIKRLLEAEQDTCDNAQLAFKICNNSGYGFPSVNPAKAILPCMEIGATITATGRNELQAARAVASRIDGATAKEYVELRADIVEKESIVDPKDDTKRVSKTDGKDYPLWKVSPTYVIEKSDQGRMPLVDCSALSSVSDEWLYKTRHDRISRNKNDIIYGDSVLGNTGVILRAKNEDDGKKTIRTCRIDEITTRMTDARWEKYGQGGVKECVKFEKEELCIWQNGGFTPVKRLIRHKCDKPIVRVLTRTGLVDCTKDHSLVLKDGTEISPNDVTIGDDLLHAKDDILLSLLSSNADTPTTCDDITESEAYAMGAFVADGSCGYYECPSGNKYSWEIIEADLDHLKTLQQKLPFKTKILDTINSSGAYKLVPNEGSIKEHVVRYRTYFYNDHREKRIPAEILNAPLSVVKQFWDGFYAGFGSKKEQSVQTARRFDQKGKEICTGLWILSRRLGWNVSIEDLRSKPEIFRLTCTKSSQRRPTESVKKMYDLVDLTRIKGYDGYVYDFETESHHFHVGPGNLVVHNTDSIMVEWSPTLFVSTALRDIQNVCEASRFLAFHINHFEYEEMAILFEKMAIGMLMKEKKNYMMRLVSEVNGKTKMYFERGGSIKRDCLPFVKNIIDTYKTSILEAMGRGEPLDTVMDQICTGIKKTIEGLYEGDYVMDDLILSKKITKIAYTKEPEHIVVASNNKKRDNPMSVGSSVFYTYEFKPFTDAEFGSYEAYLAAKKKYDELSKMNDASELQLAQQKNFLASWSSRFDGSSSVKKRTREEYERTNQTKGFATTAPAAKRINSGNVRGCPKFNRKQKGIEIAEDANYMKQKELTPDIWYIFKHRIEKPLLAQFAPIFFPRDDMPYVDTDRMSPEKIEETIKIQKKMQKEQQELTRQLLFGEFERKMETERILVCDNAYQEHLKLKERSDKEKEIERKEKEKRDGGKIVHYFFAKEKTPSPLLASKAVPSPLSSSERESFSKVRNDRYCKCVHCHGIEKIAITKDTLLMEKDAYVTEGDPYDNAAVAKNRTKLPGIICETCKKNSDVILTNIVKTIEENKETKKQIDAKCTACVYLLDNPTLDAQKCKSSYCTVFQQKKRVEATLDFKQNQLLLFSKAKKQRSVQEGRSFSQRSHVNINYEEG